MWVKQSLMEKALVGIRIRERPTEYQLERNPPKTRPEYYDVIFLNDNNKDSFLGTLNNNTVQQMLNDVRRKEDDTMDHDIKLLLDSVIDRDIEKTREKIKQLRGDITSFEQNFALNFVSHM